MQNPQQHSRYPSNPAFLMVGLGKITFERFHANPILVGTPNAWDEANSLESPMVVKQSNTYYLFYHAHRSRVGYQIGLAIASRPEGPWIKHPDNPILLSGLPGSWDDSGVAIGHVSKIGKVWYMWYEGLSKEENRYIWQIGLATASSPKGPWIKYSGNPVLKVGRHDDWDSRSLYVASVAGVNGTYYLWYVGFKEDIDRDGQLGLATAASPWGSYERHPDNPVLTSGPPGSWDGGQVNEAAILYLNSIFHAWYAGYPQKSIRESYIGYAYSYDGVKWIKYDNNPVVERGYPGEWNEHRVSEPHVLIEGDHVYLFYTGASYANDKVVETLGLSLGKVERTESSMNAHEKFPQPPDFYHISALYC